MTPTEADPILVRKALQDLGINAPVQAAYHDDDGSLVIVTREGTDTLPNGASGQATTLPEKEGIDDYTAIDGVGSVTAEKLHAKGLFTYQDLREWLARRSRAMPKRPAGRGRRRPPRVAGDTPATQRGPVPSPPLTERWATRPPQEGGRGMYTTRDLRL